LINLLAHHQQEEMCSVIQLMTKDPNIGEGEERKEK
jgi:hypothetical protein